MPHLRLDVLCFLFSICWSTLVCAQGALFWDLSLGYGRGTHEDLRLSADFVLPSLLTLSGTTQHLERPAPQKPADYEQGLCVYDDCSPRIRMNVYSILVGQAIVKRPSWRYNLRGGVALNTLEEPVKFTPAPPGPYQLMPNYRYDKKRYVNAGVLFEPRIEFLSSRTLGFALGGFAHFNKTNSAFGVFLELLGSWQLRE